MSKHLYKVYPKTDISGILPGKKRITEPTVLPLNRREFIHCMNSGKVCAILNGIEYHIKDIDYDKAEAMFDYTEKEEISKDVKIEQEENETDPISTEYPIAIDMKGELDDHQQVIINEENTEVDSVQQEKENENEDTVNVDCDIADTKSAEEDTTSADNSNKNQNVQIYQSSSNNNKKSQYNKNKKYNNSNQNRR